MKKFKEYIEENVTPIQLHDLEIVLDKLFKDVRMDVSFTRHFMDRVNDVRNQREITIEELRDIFRKSHEKFKDKFREMYQGFEGVLADAQTKVNLPFVINYNRKKKNILDIVAKTVMRKDNFATSSPKLKV